MACTPTEYLISRKTEKFGWEVLPQPPYTPDLALSDYYLFKLLTDVCRPSNVK
jgi:hypothetical protein